MIFENLKYSGSLIKEWEYKNIDAFQNMRLYYKPVSSNKDGFYFVVVEMVECKSSDIWNDPYLEVNVSIFGEARVDGLRHIYFNNKESLEEDIDKITPNGYLYYPDSKLLSQVFKDLLELEHEYCSTRVKTELYDDVGAFDKLD